MDRGRDQPDTSWEDTRPGRSRSEGIETEAQDGLEGMPPLEIDPQLRMGQQLDLLEAPRAGIDGGFQLDQRARIDAADEAQGALLFGLVCAGRIAEQAEQEDGGKEGPQQGEGTVAKPTGPPRNPIPAPGRAAIG